MTYRIIVSPRAQNEIEDAIEYYKQYSSLAPKTFIAQLDTIYDTLSRNPYFHVCYKNVRIINILKFPYSIYFVINEDVKIVKILACFHHKLHPKRRPK